MASPNESSSSRRRPGRRRLPPLEPGPALQFVVANHPDQFRAGKTMRNVRSHVMYKHRTERKTPSYDRPHTQLQRSASAYASSTANPALNSSDASPSESDYLAPTLPRPRSGTWSGPPPPEYTAHTAAPSVLRNLIHQILSSTQGSYARSAPPMFEDASGFPFPGPYGSYNGHRDSLKSEYIDYSTFFCQDRQWMQAICADQMSFLSHVSVSSVCQDLIEGLWQDSDTTVQIKTHALSTLSGQLESSDATILSILHLLLSEVGGDEKAFSVHYQGLQGLIHRRGGLHRLPYHLATYVILPLTTLAMFKRLPELTPRPSPGPITHHPRHHHPFSSPLYAPHRNFTRITHSCSTQTLSIIIDMHTLTQAIKDHSSSSTTTTTFTPSPHHHQIHNRLRSLPSTRASDWTHESIRLAALIYTHAICTHTTLASAANIQHQPGETTLLTALLSAVEHTEILTYWNDLRGVLLWVCLIGGLAAWDSAHVETGFVEPSVAWTRKCFSIWAVRVVVGVEFENADGVMEALKTGLEVRHFLERRL